MLSILIWVPLAFGLVAALLPPGASRRAIGATALVGSLAALGLTVYLVADFDSSQAGLQWLTNAEWIPQLNVRYRLGVDGISLFLLVLTAVLWVAAVATSLLREPERPRLYFLMLALAESAVLGAFTAQDLILFVVFFDLMLVPFYFLIGVWGGPNRAYATTKFVIYTLVGSLLMLVAAVATGIFAGENGGGVTFVIQDLAREPLGNGTQSWLFLFFAAAFLVKMPAFPLHAWLPDAYKAAPLPVLAVLSGVLSKVGAYGFLRIALPIFPHAASQFQDLLLVIAVLSILYGSVMAFTQNDVRLVVGFSSLAQLGFITAGIFALRAEGAQGSVLQMVNHGLVVGALFLIIALLAARAGGREDLRELGGMAFRAPVLAALFLVVSLATLAMPGSANFVGEFLILLALFKAKIVYSFVAGIGVVLASVYMIRAYQRSMHGPVGAHVSSREVGRGDAVVLVGLVACVLALAIYPQFVLKRSQDSVSASVGATHKAQAQGAAQREQARTP